MDPLADETADDAAPMNAAPDPLCIQAAAVAAQQIALDEEEIGLAEERTAFELQQRHFAAHVEAKRRELLLLRAQVRAERVAAQDAGQGDERQLSLLPAAECEQSEALEARERCLQDQVDELNQRIWRFNAEAELSRIHAKEAADKLRQSQFRWRRRRNLERAAMRVRDQQLAAAAQRIADARAQLERDQHAWLTQRQALEQELDGVNARVQNQRRTMSEQEAWLHQLEVAIVHRQQQLTALTPTETPSAAPAADIELAASDSTAGAAAQPNCPSALAAPPAVPHPRAIDLDCVAEDLADQRQQLVETWERLLARHEEWHAERTQASADLEALAQELVEREHCLHEREQANRRTEAELQERHEQATQAQQQLIAWGAQLRLEENSLSAERSRLSSESDSREAAVDQREAALVELRQRWVKRRKRELDQIECQRIALAAFRKEIAKVRRETAQRVAGLDEEKRLLAERALALEQYRAEILAGADDPAVQRNLERLRRRWLTQNAEALRRISRERNALYAELRSLDERNDALERRAAEIAAAEAGWLEKQTKWEQHQLQAQAHQALLERELQHAQAQRHAAEQQVAALRGEVERVAGALLDQSTPASLPLEQAA